MFERDSNELVSLTANVVAAYFHRNVVPRSGIPELITAVHSSLMDLRGASVVVSKARQEPAISIKKSVTPKFVTCLECGKGFKMLRRHISAVHGMTASEYKAKWGLPTNYPLVAPEYAAKRSILAKESGLGQQGNNVRGILEDI